MCLVERHLVVNPSTVSSVHHAVATAAAATTSTTTATPLPDERIRLTHVFKNTKRTDRDLGKLPLLHWSQQGALMFVFGHSLLQTFISVVNTFTQSSEPNCYLWSSSKLAPAVVSSHFLLPTLFLVPLCSIRRVRPVQIGPRKDPRKQRTASPRSASSLPLLFRRSQQGSWIQLCSFNAQLQSCHQGLFSEL